MVPKTRLIEESLSKIIKKVSKALDGKTGLNE
jgi:hypothetical protein